MKAHELKIKPRFFREVINCEKTFELRYNDRDFKVGDVLVLREYDEGYTGHMAIVEVTSILSDFDGLKPRFVIMSITLLWY